MRSPWANPTDPHMIGEMDHMEQSDFDFSQIDRARDLPPDQDDREPLDTDPYNHQEDDDDQSVT